MGEESGYREVLQQRTGGLNIESERSSVMSFDPMDCRILQVKIVEWIAFPFSSGSSQPRNQEPGSPALQLSYQGSPEHQKMIVN